MDENFLSWWRKILKLKPGGGACCMLKPLVPTSTNGMLLPLLGVVILETVCAYTRSHKGVVFSR